MINYIYTRLNRAFHKYYLYILMEFSLLWLFFQISNCLKLSGHFYEFRQFSFFFFFFTNYANIFKRWRNIVFKLTWKIKINKLKEKLTTKQKYLQLYLYVVWYGSKTFFFYISYRLIFTLIFVRNQNENILQQLVDQITCREGYYLWD